MNDIGHSQDGHQASPDGGGADAPEASRGRGSSGRIFLVGLAIIMVVWLMSYRPRPSAVEWMEDLDLARVRAAETNQLILIAFHMPGCGACRDMEREVFALEEVGEALARWVPVHLDANEHPRPAVAYGIRAVPSFAILAPSGEWLGTLQGPMDAPTFIDTIDRIRTKWEEDRPATVPSASGTRGDEGGA